jgi:hypothetical protein
MKLDKETLVKQRFWVLLIAFLPLVLFAILFLWTWVDSGIAEQQAKIEAKKSELKRTKDGPLKNNNDIRLLDERAKDLEKKKATVWEESWKWQKDLFTWPNTELGNDLGQLAFGDPIPDKDRDPYLRAYEAQTNQLGAMFIAKYPVGPQNTEREFVSTLFKDGWKKRVRFVENFYEHKTNVLPSSEEIWLSQEDYWLQRELLRSIRDANEVVGRFVWVEALKPEKGEVLAQRFKNANWQLDLAVSEKSGSKDANYILRGKLKNVSHRRMPPGQHYFGIKFTEGSNLVILDVDSDALGVDQEWTIKDHPVSLSFNPPRQANEEEVRKIEVSQVYDSKEGPSRPPVRRIDQLALGYHSNRTADALKPDPKVSGGEGGRPSGRTGRERPGPGGPGPGGPAPGGPGPGAPGPGGPGPGGPGPGGPGQSAGADGKTENGLPRDRYSDITGQVRRMPVAMVVVVDQANLPDLITSLTNSKLRLQVTQVDWQHFRGSIRIDDGAPTTVGTEGPMGRPLPPISRPLPSDAASSSAPNDENLIEATIYGIASLYEKYATPKAPAAPPAK